MQNLLRKIIPGYLKRLMIPLFYGWRGNYDSWDVAKHKCSGYDSHIILEKVKESALKVKNGQVAFERDSVIFAEVQYSFPLLSGLMWIAAQNSGRLNVLDFGGSLGSSYYQNLHLLQYLEDFHWCIVEQPHFVEEGVKSFANDNLHFFYNMKECLKEYNIHVVLFSSVLQYMKEPYKILEEVFNHNIEYIIIDRTPFLRKGNDRITVQKVPEWIYKAKYPCWFFNKTKFLNFMNQSYKLILEFDALDKANITSEFKGFLFRKIIE